ncbi:hypothetical protein DRJ17_06770 [Candidatus Woesearchaeota archaeon]|nr:MAG: hypothetical protein DRJ17_06770 [Candidatus Woesearchaeota archaeon]
MKYKYSLGYQFRRALESLGINPRGRVLKRSSPEYREIFRRVKRKDPSIKLKFIKDFMDGKIYLLTDEKSGRKYIWGVFKKPGSYIARHFLAYGGELIE